MKEHNKFWPFICIFLFVFLVHIKNLAFWSPDRTFIFGDTSTFALHLSALALNFGTIFDWTKSIYLWNPNHLAVGIPTLSLIDGGFLYPPNIIIAFLAYIFENPMLAIPLYTIGIFFHLILGSVFLFKLLKDFFKTNFIASLIGSLLWIGIGFNTESVVAAPVLMAGTYLPICVFFILKWRETQRKKYFFAFFISLALSFLVGYPMVTLLIYLLSLLISFLFEKEINQEILLKNLKAHLIGFFLITLPLIAPLYFSVVTHFANSVRSMLTLDSFLGNASPPQNIIESILPMSTLANPHPIANIYLYFSLVGLIILLQSKIELFKEKRNIFLLTIGLVGFIMALGQITPIPTLTYYLLPLINLFRRLSIFSIVPSFIFCLLVAQAVENTSNNKSISNIIVFVFKVFIVFFLIGQAATIAHLDSIIKTGDLNQLYYSVIFVFIVGGLTLLGLSSYKYSPKLAGFILFFALVVEIGSNVSSKVTINSRVNPSLFFKKSELIQVLNQIVKPMERVDLNATQYFYNTDYFDIEQINGYLSLGSKYSDGINNKLNDPGYNAKNLRNLLGIKYKVEYLDSKSATPSMDDTIVKVEDVEDKQYEYYQNTNNEWQPVPVGTEFIIRKNNDALPRLFLAKDIRANIQSDKVLNEIEGNDVRNVLVDQNQMKDIIFTKDDNVTIEQYKRNYIKAKVTTTYDSFLANTTAYYLGWTVKVNGKPAKLIQTNWFMMGVYLPAGENTVEFMYIPYGFIAGLIYLFTASVIWVIWFIFSSRNRSKIKKLA